jgi:hypothetical protein
MTTPLSYSSACGVADTDCNLRAIDGVRVKEPRGGTIAKPGEHSFRNAELEVRERTYEPIQPSHWGLLLDRANECVHRGGRQLKLTPKAFAVRRHLIEQHGLVTRDQCEGLSTCGHHLNGV